VYVQKADINKLVMRQLELPPWKRNLMVTWPAPPKKLLQNGCCRGGVLTKPV